LGTRRPNNPATSQGLDQRSKREEVLPKMAHQRDSDARQSVDDRRAGVARRTSILSCVDKGQLSCRLIEVVVIRDVIV